MLILNDEGARQFSYKKYGPACRPKKIVHVVPKIEILVVTRFLHHWMLQALGACKVHDILQAGGIRKIDLRGNK